MPRQRQVVAQKPNEGLKLPKEEQLRLINESGVLEKLTGAGFRDGNLANAEDSASIPLADEIFNATLLVIPFSFLLLMFEILIQQQYARQPTLRDLADRMVPSVPILSIFIFYTSRYKQHRLTQFLLFWLSVAAGTRMLYLLKRGSWLVNMKQPPTGHNLGIRHRTARTQGRLLELDRSWGLAMVERDISFLIALQSCVIRVVSMPVSCLEESRYTFISIRCSTVAFKLTSMLRDTDRDRRVNQDHC